MSKLWLYTFLWGMVFSSGGFLHSGPEDFIAKDSSYYLTQTSSENIYLLQNSNKSLIVSDHLVFLPPGELGLELKEVPQNLRLASVPVALTGVVALPLGRSFLDGALGSGKKVLLSVVGVGAVVGYLWHKIHGTSSLEELGVLLSAGETEGEASPSSSKWTDDSFASDPHSPDPKSIPFPWHKDFVEQISAEGVVNPGYLPLASQGYDYTLAVLGIVVAIKSLEQVAGHFKYDPESSNPDFHKSFFEGALIRLIEFIEGDDSLQGHFNSLVEAWVHFLVTLIEGGDSLQEAHDLIMDPHTGKPRAGLGVMFESPYAPMLLSTMARLEVLRKVYGLSAQGVDQIYEWWISRTSFERTKVLGLFSASDALAVPMRLLAGAQKLAYKLQSWDVNSDLAHRQDDIAMTDTLIMEFENDVASKFDMSLSSLGPTYIKMNIDVRSFHRNKQVLAETPPAATVFVEKSMDAITKDDFIGARSVFAEVNRHSLYLKTFLDLHRIYQSSKDPWYVKRLAQLKLEETSAPE